MSENFDICENTEKQQIKVSVIIPIYNAYDYLRPAMDSVIDQTLREIEIICIIYRNYDRDLNLLLLGIFTNIKIFTH